MSFGRSSAHERFMREAIALAVENVRAGAGGPFAALIVEEGRVIARGVNRVTATNDPTAHAEVVAIRAACGARGSFRLAGCELYSTCEPCPMCLGAVYWSRLDRYYYGKTRREAAAIGFDDSLIYDEMAKAPELRSVAGLRLLPDEAAAPFDEWTRSTSKVPY